MEVAQVNKATSIKLLLSGMISVLAGIFYYFHYRPMKPCTRHGTGTWLAGRFFCIHGNQLKVAKTYSVWTWSPAPKRKVLRALYI